MHHELFPLHIVTVTTWIVSHRRRAWLISRPPGYGEDGLSIRPRVRKFSTRLRDWSNRAQAWLRSGAGMLITASLVAALVPGLPTATPGRAHAVDVAPDFPMRLHGRALQPLPVSAREKRFLAGFAGAVQRYTDGERDIVMRWVTQPTRRLHPAADCYRGLGYRVGEGRIVNVAADEDWRCFDAEDADARQRVCERIVDRSGRAWTDVSAWYWDATLGRSVGPWLVTTVAEDAGP